MPRYEEFKKRFVIVGGAGSGIGMTTAIAFANQGTRATVSDIHAQVGEAAVAQIRQADGKASFVQADFGHAQKTSTR
jgi:NAD(P)-dependent dehydrogenase (short-subunit alcohol dehydrogenase family)